MSAEPKFTPGPWHVCGDGNCSCFTVMCADHPIAQVTSGDWGDDYPSIRLVGESSLTLKAEAYIEQITYGSIDELTARANWNLIAAAPDLYKACSDAFDFLGGIDGASALRSVLLAALSKANPHSSDPNPPVTTP